MTNPLKRNSVLSKLRQSSTPLPRGVTAPFLGTNHDIRFMQVLAAVRDSLPSAALFSRRCAKFGASLCKRRSSMVAIMPMG